MRRFSIDFFPFYYFIIFMFFVIFCYNLIMKFKNRLSKWLDGFVLAGKGILLAMHRVKFWVVFLIVFCLFGTLMNLLSNGFSSFQLMGAVGFFGSLEIIRDAFFGIFGVNKTFLDWLLVFLISLLQGLLISLIVLVFKMKKKANSENIERAGIVTGLAVLGAGCPTCGTALLTPVIGAIFSGGSAIVGTVSWIITLIAILIAVFALRKIGEDTYVIITSEKYRKKKKEEKDGEGN